MASSKPPFTIRHFADVGTGEPFLARLLGLLDILNATLYLDKKPINDAIGAVFFDGILPAFLSLRELRKLVADPKSPVLTVTKTFEEMSRLLWVGYKDRMQTALRVMGFDLGFLFQKQPAFEAGCEKFQKEHSEIGPEFIERLKTNRDMWQNRLATFRNDYLEHQTITKEEVAEFYQLQNAEVLFTSVWVAVEEIVVTLLASKHPPGVALAEIPEDKRHPALAKRFGFLWGGTAL